MFDTLVDHFKDFNKQIKSRIKLGAYNFYYIPVIGEDKREGWEHAANILDPIVRPVNRRHISGVPHIRSNFCFRFETDENGNNKIWIRQLSCHCNHCLTRKWADCTEARRYGAEPDNPFRWKSFTMYSVASVDGISQQSLRSRRSVVSEKRRNLAKKCRIGQWVALESSDDAEGFSFWLARVLREVEVYTGTARTENGVKFKPGGHYLTVRFLERSPVNCPSMFQYVDPHEKDLFDFCSKDDCHECVAGVMIIDAEGVVATDVQLKRLGRGSQRSSVRSTRLSGLYSLSEEDLEKLEDDSGERLND